MAVLGKDLQPYATYRDSGVAWLGEVPAHWNSPRLKCLLSRNDAGTWGDCFTDDGTIVLRSTEQTVSGGWRITSPARIQLTPDQRRATLLEVGDLLVTKSSGSAQHIGKTSLVTDDVAHLNCCFSNFMQRLRPAAGLNPTYLWRVLNSPVGRRQLAFRTTTTTGLGNLNGTILGETRIPLPPPGEQAAIVRFLDHADRKIRRAIRAKQKLVKLLEEEKQAVIHRAVTRGLDPNVRLKPSGVEWLGDVPEHWGVLRLKYVSPEITVGVVVNPSSYFIDAGVPMLLGNNIKPGNIRTARVRRISDESNQRLAKSTLRAGDVVIVRVGAPGVAAVVPPDLDGCNCASVLIVRQGPCAEPKWIEYLFNSSVMRDQIDVVKYGAAQKQFNVAHAVEFWAPTPPIDEQRAIIGQVSAKLARSENAAEHLEREIDLLREYRTRLIADVVTGKLDVREAATRLPDEAPGVDAADDTGAGTMDEAADSEVDGDTEVEPDSEVA